MSNHKQKQTDIDADDNKLTEQDFYLPPENPKPSALWEFIKFILILALVLFVSFFIYCSVQLGEIGH